MRSFYTDATGRRADLCQAPGFESTRLVIRSADGSVILRKTYRTWHAATIALGWHGRWTNELTGRTLGRSRPATA